MVHPLIGSCNRSRYGFCGRCVPENLTSAGTDWQSKACLVSSFCSVEEVERSDTPQFERFVLDKSAIVKPRLVVWLLLGLCSCWPHQAVPPKPPSGIALSYEASPAWEMGKCGGERMEQIAIRNVARQSRGRGNYSSYRPLSTPCSFRHTSEVCAGPLKRVFHADGHKANKQIALRVYPLRYSKP